ncbi:hypothetical protein [Humisphaera borealis]|uniref:Uncharacterized protein n=1 Tax=Humisphaera borealis TaxID=2807512 RepID=A0A7M2WX98_9BACT|nr:hypothetical protein [Humisphaera borealis]QOV90029.1 hypothetical protein IPV69_01250 [Humisphaera borealis]
MTIGQAARRLGALDALEASLLNAEQPGGPRWRDNVCQVRLEIAGSQIATALSDAAEKGQGLSGLGEEDFARRLAHLKTQRFTGVGQSGEPAVVVLSAPVQKGDQNASRVPKEAPEWVGRQMDADGRGAGSGLKGARAAESVALSQLRRQIDELPLRDGLTIGQAAAKDPRLDRVVTEAMRRARVSRVIYGVDGAEVRVSFDLDHFWRELLKSE